MNRTGYLSIVSSDIYNYCKKFVYKHLFPPNLLATPTVFYECQHPIINVKSHNDRIYFLYKNIIYNMHNGPINIHNKEVRDIAFTTDGEILVRDTEKCFSLSGHGSMRGCVSAVIDETDNLYVLAAEHVVTAYKLDPPLSFLGVLNSISLPLWSHKDINVEKIVDYNQCYLLFIYDCAFALVNKSTSYKRPPVQTLSAIYDAVVDDEGSILLQHLNRLTLWNSALQCIRTFKNIWSRCICLHNHTLLFVNYDNKVLAIQ